jgi:hypothetical protein
MTKPLPVRIASSGDRRHQFTRPERWQVLDPASERRKGQAIRAGVGYEEDEVTVRAENR